MPQPSVSRAPSGEALHNRQPFQRPHTSISPIAHWLKQAGILSPLLIAQFVKDPERRWRYTRIALVLVTVLSETLWTAKLHRQRKECEEQRER